MTTPLSAEQALDRYFPEARSKILDLAAVLDRIDRGAGASTVAKNPRLEQLRRGLAVLLEKEGNRAERVQQVFSLPYEAGWEKPKPRG